MNKMVKQNIYIAGCLSALIALSACTNQDNLNYQYIPEQYIVFGWPAINFETGTGNFTTRSGLKNSIDKFQVWGFRRPLSVTGNTPDENSAPKDWNDKSIFFRNGADVFRNLNVNVNSSFTEYNNNSPTEWDTNKASSYSFIAVASDAGTFSMENAVSTTGSEHGPRLRFILTGAGSALTDYTNQPDAMIATKFDHHSNDGMVDLAFSHIMMGLRFKFHNHNSDKELVIKKVTVSGQFYNEAIFDLTKDKVAMSVSGTYYNGNFTLLDGSQSIAAGTSDYMGSSENPTTLLLLPNPNATLNDDALTDPTDEFALGKNKTITITYSIGGVDRAPFELKNFRLNYLPNTNSLHTANFHFVGDEFVVMFQADNNTNWEDGSDNEVTIH